jgi:hypothetical protein
VAQRTALKNHHGQNHHAQRDLAVRALPQNIPSTLTLRFRQKAQIQAHQKRNSLFRQKQDAPTNLSVQSLQENHPKNDACGETQQEGIAWTLSSKDIQPLAAKEDLQSK